MGVGLGLMFSIQRTIRVQELERIHQDVQSKAGMLRVEDASKVYVTPVNSPNVPLLLQKQNVRVWQFQIHLPAGYVTRVIKLGGPISDDGLQNRGGRTSLWNSPEKEAIRGLWTLTLHAENGRWILSTSGPSSSGRTYLRAPKLESVGDLTFNTICPEPGQTVEIPPDQFFNLIRIRTAEKVPNGSGRKQGSGFYPGAALWIGPQSSQPAFDAVSSGSQAPDDLAKVILNE